MIPLLFIAMLPADTLFVATPLTAENSFTKEIEGPAVDKAGNIYAVSFARKPTVGKVTPEGKAEVFLEMPEGSLANGIRFDRKGVMFLADYAGHTLALRHGHKEGDGLRHEPTMNQPNHIADLGLTVPSGRRTPIGANPPGNSGGSIPTAK